MKTKENLSKSFIKRNKQQRSITKISLKVKDLVLIRVRHLSNTFDRTNKKFFHLYEGPYRIKKVINEYTFLLTEKDNEEIEKGIYNQKNLRKYFSHDNIPGENIVEVKVLTSFFYDEY